MIMWILQINYKKHSFLHYLLLIVHYRRGLYARKHVWKTFHMVSLGEYHDIYLLSDTLQLADVFDNFRDICFHYYELDPDHFYTSPGLAWQACIKMTGQRLLTPN